MKRLLPYFVIAMSMLLSGIVQAQDYLNLVPDWNRSSEDEFPVYPPKGDIYTWYYTNRGTNWDTDYYIPFVYDDMPFRLMPPNGVDFSGNENSNNYNFEFSDPNKKYPLVIMLHGIGEKGVDNNHQLKHGGRQHRDAVLDSEFPGYVMFPQNWGNYFGEDKQRRIVDIIEMLAQEAHVDINRITVHGLSAGGSGVWNIIPNYARYFAAIVPMSAANPTTVRDNINVYKYIPTWLSQGGRDSNPQPSSAYAIKDLMDDAGANMKLTVYENLGHGTWNSMYAEPDFFPFLLRANKTNIHVFYGGVRKPEDPVNICPGDPVNIRLGITAGFNGYEWRKDGNLISGAAGNEYVATTFGQYQVRFRRGTVWTDWSLPLVIQEKDLSNTPSIQTVGLASRVLPALNGSNSVELGLAEEYFEYRWSKVGTSEILSTNATYVATEEGDYTVSVKDISGCFSNFSQPFKVVVGNGANSPDPPVNLTAQALSETEVLLNWDQNPTPTNNETNFEIYRGTKAGGAYTLIQITGADVSTFTDVNLTSNTAYYYKIRGINNNGGSTPTNESNAKTLVDTEPPTAPTNLQVTNTSPSSIGLSWDAAEDNVGVFRYDVYRNGSKVLVTENTEVSMVGLTAKTVYTFTVKARDEVNNTSQASNQVTAATVFSGLTYNYYEGEWDALPNFNNLTPVSTGKSPNVDISEREQNDNFAFKWEGFIDIPVSGNYTFETRSDDGSKLYVNPGSSGSAYNESYLVVNNDGLHGNQYREGTINLTAGAHPIAITYFERGGGENIQIFWKNTAHGVGSRQAIPDDAFTEEFTMPTPPAAPTNIVATTVSYDQIDLGWTKNSTNDSGFEIYRATKPTGPFNIVATVSGTSYSDKNLDPETTYYYRVQAVGPTGESGFSTKTGLDYSYYHGSWSSLPDFNSLTPEATGVTDNFDISLRTRNDNFAFKFDGVIKIPTSGQYTFFTSSDDGSKLYINGNQVVDNDGLHGNQERSGTINLSAGVHDITVTFFERGGGESLQVRWQGPGINKQLIPADVLGEEDANATTSPLPSPPNAPTNLTATPLSTSSIELSWTDASNNEEKFEVFRSVGSNTDFKLLTIVDAVSGSSSTVTFVNTSLFPNTSYYYKVRSVGVGGPSAFTSEISVGTQNSSPVIAETIDDFSMRFGTTETIDLSAADDDGDNISFAAVNLPSFGSLTDNGNGTAQLVFNPEASDDGTYADIRIVASDDNGGSDEEAFTLIVSGNFVPVLATIGNQSVDENQSLDINLSATDENTTDVLTFSTQNLPTFASLTDNNDGTAVITVSPGYTDQGSYQVEVSVSDDNGGVDKEVITVTVNNVSTTYTVSVNFSDDFLGPNPWNNTDKAPALNDQFTNLINDAGNATGISMTLMTAFGGVFDEGATTGNNSGIYPDNVMREYYYFGVFGSANEQTIKISGLDEQFTYDFSFFASSVWPGTPDNGNTEFSIGGTTVSLYVQGNTSNTADITRVVPDANGEVLITLTKGANSEVGYINALQINAYLDNGNASATPSELVADVVSGTQIDLSWKDNSATELSFKVYRGLSEDGSFEMIGTTGVDENSFSDTGVSGNTTYFYKVLASNANGSSDFSETISATTPNGPPAIVDFAPPVFVNEGETTDVPVSATDGEGDPITLSASNLPSFASFTDNGDGTGVITFTPTFDDIGEYTGLTVEAADDAGNSSSEVFDIRVKDRKLTSVLVNFGKNVAPAPWNNTNTNPVSGKNFNNLTDEFGSASGINLSLQSNWAGSATQGAVTGDNSGIYPDVVMQSYYYANSGSVMTIRAHGLKQGTTYNFVFFSSSKFRGYNGEVDFTIGGETVSLTAQSNTENTIQINGITPNSNGEVFISIRNGADATYAFLNAMEIQSFTDDGLPFLPVNLEALGVSRTQIDLSWKDRSGNETGYEIYRSGNADGPFNLIHSTGANVDEYSDTNLSPNTGFFYQIRAVNSTGTSDFTEVVSASTLDYSVYINFNDGSNQSAPWNNTNKQPLAGDNHPGLLKEDGVNSGINLRLVNDWDGANPFGTDTGNDSGVYPDNVMRTFYFLEVGTLATLRLSGFNPSYRYNFEFFAASTFRNDNGETMYTINGETVLLHVQDNISRTVRIKDVEPDINGEVLIDIVAAPDAIYGYLNAMVIHAYEPAGSLSARYEDNSTKKGGFSSSLDEEFENAEVSLSTYPNPFANELNVTLSSIDDEPVTLSIVDALGRIYLNEKVNVTKELNTFTFDMSDLDMTSGMYLLKVNGNAYNGKIFRLLKQ